MKRLHPSEIIIGIGGNQSGGTAGTSRRIRRSAALIAAQTAGPGGPRRWRWPQFHSARFVREQRFWITGETADRA
jgi:hypothetical protein